MKFLIASDIHGSRYYMELLARRFEEERADLLVLLGDIYNHGPRNPLPEDYDPLGVAKILNALTDRLLVVKGNCDSDVDTMISDFEFVSEAVLVSGNKQVFLQHGDRYCIDNLPQNSKDAFVYGHYHTSFIERKKGVLVANPGSVSLPKNGTARAYLLLEEGTMTLKALDGEVLAEEKI